MNDINRIKRNIVIFTIFITICGWIGYFIDKLTGSLANLGQGDLGASADIFNTVPDIFMIKTCFIVLLVFSLIAVVTNFFLIFRNNKKMYLISFLIYPAVTLTVLLSGLVTKGIRFSIVNIGITAYIGILFAQIVSQFIKNIFEESVWRAYLTNQLLKLKLSDLKIYLLAGGIWWVWHLPYIMIFLSESEIQSTLPVSRLTFFLIGTVVVTCWTVMYTEIFKVTKSMCPSVIMHTMEDAVINPLLLLGIVSVEKSQAFLFSLSVGIIPTILYLIVGLSIRRWRKKQEKSLHNQ